MSLIFTMENANILEMSAEENACRERRGEPDRVFYQWMYDWQNHWRCRKLLIPHRKRREHSTSPALLWRPRLTVLKPKADKGERQKVCTTKFYISQKPRKWRRPGKTVSLCHLNVGRRCCREQDGSASIDSSRQVWWPELNLRNLYGGRRHW